MPKKLDKPVERTLIALYISDKATLKEFYPSVGYNLVVRELVHNFCNKLRERASREGATSNVGPQPELDLDISTLVDGAGAGPA